MHLGGRLKPQGSRDEPFGLLNLSTSFAPFQGKFTPEGLRFNKHSHAGNASLKHWENQNNNPILVGALSVSMQLSLNDSMHTNTLPDSSQCRRQTALIQRAVHSSLSQQQAPPPEDRLLLQPPGPGEDSSPLASCLGPGPWRSRADFRVQSSTCPRRTAL